MVLDTDPLWFDFFGIEVEVATNDPECRRLLSGNLAFFASRGKKPALRYVVYRGNNRRFEVLRDTGSLLFAADDGDFFFQLEKDITIEIQKRRQDLYFIHAAVLDYKDAGFLLVANSGGGKSTTTWALCHHGFQYLSDELAPVDLRTLEVLPYSHALSLKHHPPSPYELPSEAIRTSRTIHVPVSVLPGGNKGVPASLEAIFFVSFRPNLKRPCAVPMSRTEAAARLFPNALNPLAHPGDGLDAALKIAARCSSFELVTNDLTRTCSVVKQTMESLQPQPDSL